MAKRFGRNQRRKLRELQVSNVILEKSIRDLKYQTNSLRQTNQQLQDRHEREIRQARVTRDSIKITVDAILDPMERRTRVMARFDMLGSQRSPLYSAQEVDMIEFDSDIERGAFIKYAGEHIAEHALAQILRHWRSR